MPLDPITASILAAGIKGVFDIGGTIAQNRYNRTAAMKRRLREAGLPLAYMYQGRVAEQSQVPELSIDPDLGSVEKEQLSISKGQLSETQRMNEQQLKNLSEQLQNLQMDNQILRGELNWKLNQGETFKDKSGQTYSRTNQEILLDNEKSISNSITWLRENEAKFKQILLDVEDAFYKEGGQLQLKREELSRIKQQIVNLVSQDKLLGQMHSIRSIEEELNKALSEGIKDEDDLTKGIIYFLMKLFDKTRL